MCHPLFRRGWLVLVLAVASAGSTTADDWPQFRGPHRDGISRETGLLRSWPAGGPEQLWSVGVGPGYSGAAIHDGRVFVHDYDTGASEWQVRALALLDGKELWTFRESRRIRPNHGITRTVPATDGRTVFSLDPKAVLHALDAGTGTERWRTNLVERYGAQIPPWYAGQCPLLDEGRLLIAPGGAALVVALDPTTGDELWRSPNPEGWAMSHASVMPAILDGVPQYLYATLQGVVGVAREDGRRLWSAPFSYHVAVAPSPLPVGGDRVFLTAGYDAGSVMLRIHRAEGEWLATEDFALSADTWNSEVHTPIVLDGGLLGVDKKKRGQLTRLDLDGSVSWSTGGRLSFELGGYLVADGLLLILDGQTGILRLIEVSPEGYRELANAAVLGGHDVWAPPALADGVLLVRDMTRLVALRVGGSS